jgi:hypothetical protein
MQKLLSVAVVLSSCGICLAVEPVIPLPPETTVIESSRGEVRPALPTVAEPAAESTAAPWQPTTPAPVVDQPVASPWIGPANAWYGYSGYIPVAVVPETNAGLHVRYPYYSYRRPWYPAGPESINVTIIW